MSIDCTFGLILLVLLGSRPRLFLQRQAVRVRVSRRLFVGLIAVAIATSTAFAAEPEAPYGYNEAVQAYREANYPAAQVIFARLHRDYPENTRITYYLAISEAQQGDVKAARRLYNEILLLDPNGEAAKLAREGLEYLPDESATSQNNALDAPPKVSKAPKRIDPESSLPKAVQKSPPATAAIRIEKAAEAPQTAQTAETPSAAGQNTGTAQNAATAQTYGGVSPQDMMMWQMMMSQGGNNAVGGGFNPWTTMAPAMYGNNGVGGSTDGGAPANIDPNIMSTMLMNQMMQNFSLDGNKDPDR